DDECGESVTINCPFGPPGTRLAVREAWQYAEFVDGDCEAMDPASVVYRADANEHGGVYYVCADGVIRAGSVKRWRSPATMPAWAVRRHKTVAWVRVGRCGEIGEAEAKAWGMSSKFAMQGVWLTRFGTRCPFASSWAWVVGVDHARV